MSEVRVLEKDVLMQQCTAESMQARCNGEKITLSHVYSLHAYLGGGGVLT